MYLVIALSQFFEAEVFVFVLKRSFCASVKPRTYKSDLSRQSLSTPERQKSFLSFCFSVHVQSEWQLRTHQESVNCLAKYSKKEWKVGKVEKKKLSTRMGFEPTRAEHNGLAVHRLNHSATSSTMTNKSQIRVLKLFFKIVTLKTVSQMQKIQWFFRKFQTNY